MGVALLGEVREDPVCRRKVASLKGAQVGLIIRPGDG